MGAIFAVFSLGLLGFLVFIIAVPLHVEKQRKAAWQEAADRLHLHYTGDQIHGKLSDTVVRVRTEKRPLGMAQGTWTVFEASIGGEVPLGLRLSSEGVMVKLEKATGSSSDIHLDLPGVDAKLHVQAKDVDEVRAWARRSDISRALADLAELEDDFLVQPHEMMIDVKGGVADPDTIVRKLERLVDIARALSGKGYGALIDDGSWP